MTSSVTAATLAEFASAWNRHDIDALMTFMTDDCIFETVAGPDACGSRHVGRDAVRTAFMSAWQNFPDAQWRDGRHWVCGERGVSESLFTGTAADGSRVEANMVDLFVFREGKIHVKNAFRKARTPAPAK